MSEKRLFGARSSKVWGRKLSVIDGPRAEGGILFVVIIRWGSDTRQGMFQELVKHRYMSSRFRKQMNILISVLPTNSEFPTYIVIFWTASLV